MVKALKLDADCVCSLSCFGATSLQLCCAQCHTGCLPCVQPNDCHSNSYEGDTPINARLGCRFQAVSITRRVLGCGASGCSVVAGALHPFKLVHVLARVVAKRQKRVAAAGCHCLASKYRGLATRVVYQVVCTCINTCLHDFCCKQIRHVSVASLVLWVLPFRICWELKLGEGSSTGHVRT